ncbi:MAG TPA: GNAT family N-acetyltransferase [Candidatus Limnocylindria bacterium]|nr:GNAT family N-acetyltransferase [Candidatus Limnocylindria bacterium]
MTEPIPTFRLRRGTADDSRRAFDIFLPAVRDLTQRLNVPWEVEAEALWERMRYLWDRLADHHAEWWFAEDEATGEAIGYARSVERGGLLELTEFFVHPGSQAGGVGRRLLERAFPADRGEVRAIIATTDTRAQSRYYRAGTAARFPIASLEAEPRPVELGDAKLEVERLAPDADLAPLRRIEAEVLEFDRGDEFRWLLGQREGYLYRRGGEPIGFAFVGRSTGPIAALDPADQVPILRHVESRAAALGVPMLSLEVPMPNEVAVRHLLSRGFRIDPFYTFLMSSRPVGQFDRFIGFAPPFFL